MMVLIVEDDVQIRTLVRDGLEQHDIAVTEAATVAEANQAFAGEVFSRGDLLAMVWRSSADWQSNTTVTEHVRRVRNKIEDDPHHPSLLRTVRGAGYRFDLPVVPEAGAPRDETHARGTVITVGSRIVAVDRVALALLGSADPAELIGAHVLDFVAPQSLRPARERIRQVAIGADARSQVLLVVRPDGTEVPLEITTSARTGTAPTPPSSGSVMRSTNRPASDSSSPVSWVT